MADPTGPNKETVDLLKEMNKQLKDIANIFGAVRNSSKQVSDDVTRLAKQTLDFDKILTDVLFNSKEIGSKFKSTHDIQQKMQTDARFFAKAQKEVWRTAKEGLAQMKAARLAQVELIEDEAEREKERAKALVEIEETQRIVTNDLQRQLDLTARVLKHNNKIELSMKNVSHSIDDMGAKIRQPSAFAQSFLEKVGGWAPSLLKANQEGKSFVDILGGMKTKAIAGGEAFAKLFGATGILIGGIGLVSAAMSTLFKLFTNYWDFLDKKVIPANAEFNKQIGIGTQKTAGLRSQMQSTGVEFELLGKSFEEGTQLIRDLAVGLKTGLEIPRDVLKTGKELTAVLQLSGDEAGSLIVQFQKSGNSVQKLNQAFIEGKNEAEKYGVPVNEVLRDIGKSPNILARFGVKNAEVFARAASKAKSYGLSIQEINAAFGKQLDTFEGSSTAAANLNAIFGTTINSYQLMLETNPVKRMELLRSALERQGKSWEKLSVQEKNVITSTLNVEESQASLILSSEKERKILQARAKDRERQIKIDEHWNKGMGSIKQTLIAWGPLLDKLMRSASNFIVRLFGGKDAASEITGLANVAEKAIGSITKTIDEMTASLTDENKLDFKQVGSDIASSFKTVVEAIKTSVDLIKDFKDGISSIKESMFSFTNRDLSVKTDVATQRLFNSLQTSGDIFSLGSKSLKELREVEQNTDAKNILEKKLLERGISKEQIDKAFADLYSAKALKVAPAQEDAYIHKSGRLVPISEEDNILVRKDMKKVNQGESSSSSSALEIKELQKTVQALQQTVDKLASALTNNQKIVLTDINGSYIGRGLVQNARGST